MTKLQFKRHCIISVLALLWFTSNAQNTITFIITDVPAYTPVGDTLYLSSSLDNWQEASQSKRFKLFPDGNYRLTVDVGQTKTFEYKINRGNWDKVEANNWGDYMANRNLTYNDSIFEVHLSVVAWQDLHQNVYPTIEVIVNEVPKNTPHDASIYITGTFNNWIDRDETYKLERHSDGTYTGKIPPGHDTIYYKFIRGPWETIESRWDGGMRSNRTYIASLNDNHRIVAQISTWADLSTRLNWMKGIYLALFIQGMILISISRSKRTVTFPVVLSVLFSAIFFMKYLYLDYSMLIKYPKGYFLPAISFSIVVVLEYVLVKNKIRKQNTRFSILFGVPIALFLVYLIPCMKPSNVFYLNVVNNQYSTFYIFSYAIGIALQQILLVKLKRQVRNSDANTMSKTANKLYLLLQYYNAYTVFIVGIAIVLHLQSVDSKLIIDLFEHFIWIGLGGTMIYYQRFYLTVGIVDSYKGEGPYVGEEHNSEGWMELKGKLNRLITEDSVFLDPDLSLSDLAMHLNTNTLYVSKLINECYKKSYTDFVNDYRVDTFIKSVNQDNNNQPFLYHAFNAGFNSKSAFYRAFKKKENMIPSEYFSALEKTSS